MHAKVNKDKAMSTQIKIGSRVRFVDTSQYKSIPIGAYGIVINKYNSHSYNYVIMTDEKYLDNKVLCDTFVVDTSLVTHVDDYTEVVKNMKDSKIDDANKRVEYARASNNKTPIEIGSRVRFIKDDPYYSITKGDYANVKGFNKHSNEVSITDDYGCRITTNISSIVHENDYVESDKAMNTLEAMQALVAGKKIRKNYWSEFHYIYAVNNVIVNEHNKPHSFYINANLYNDWEEYKEPVWNWKVGDKLLYSNIGGSCEYEVLYVNNDAIFCKGPCYSYFTKANNIGSII